MHIGVLVWAALIAGFGVLDAILSKVRRKYRTRMVTCVIRPEQLNDVTSALQKAQLMPGMTVMEARGFGRQKGGHKLSSDDPIRFLPKLRIEILVRELDMERTTEVISDCLRTGQIGDGKIIVFKAVSTMRIRTGETGLSAL